ncbi:MAG: ester cyclase [Solirubrobacteraceae bacterium]
MPDNKARATAFWTDVFNAKDLDRADEFIAPGSVNHNALPGTPDGPEGLRASFGRLWTGFPDMKFEIDTILAEDNKVVCVGMMSGTHDGPFAGMPPSGRTFRTRHVHILTFDDAGLVTEHLAVRDDISQLKQIGALPESLGQPGQPRA